MRWTGIARVVWLGLVLFISSTQGASAGHWNPRWGPIPGQEGTVVYRPVYPGGRVVPTKPLYLSNYAGVVYPTARRRWQVSPTTQWAPNWFGRRTPPSAN